MLRRRFLQGLAALFAFPVAKTKAVEMAIVTTFENPAVEPIITTGQIMMVPGDFVEVCPGVLRITTHMVWNGEEWIRWEDHPDSP